LTKQEEGLDTLRGEVAENLKRINALEGWRCSHRIHVLKEWLGMPHTDSRNALFHGADIEADLALFRYAIKYEKINLLSVENRLSVKAIGLIPRWLGPRGELQIRSKGQLFGLLERRPKLIFWPYFGKWNAMFAKYGHRDIHQPNAQNIFNPNQHTHRTLNRGDHHEPSQRLETILIKGIGTIT
jgi:hypothetical protein